MKHLDAFSGIGGWALAAREAGFDTIGFCESNPRAKAFLERAWGLPVHPDIKTLDGKQYHGRLTLFTASPPCQPASRAGKQGGASDDRWLWPDTLRVLAEAKPAWCVFENPPGILDLDFDGILSEMEGISYEVQTFNIPACAVDSPQTRERIWIIGHLGGASGVADLRCEPGGENQPERGQDQRASGRRDRAGDVADCDRNGCRAGGRKGGVSVPSNQIDLGRAGFGGESDWSRYVWVPCENGKIRRAPDGSFSMVHGLPVELLEALGEEEAEIEHDKDGYPSGGIPHTSIIEALGNSICWPVAAEILKAIAQVESRK